MILNLISFSKSGFIFKLKFKKVFYLTLLYVSDVPIHIFYINSLTFFLDKKSNKKVKTMGSCSPHGLRWPGPLSSSPLLQRMKIDVKFKIFS